MAINFIQQATNTFTASATVIVTLAASPKARSLLVVCAVNDSTTISSVSGGGVTWVVGKASATAVPTELWYGLNSSGSGTAITVTYASGVGSGGANVSEYSGIISAGAVDAVPASTSGTSTTPTSPVGATKSGNELVMALAGFNTASATTNAGPTNGFTALTETQVGQKLIPAYQIVATAGSYSTSWTESVNTTWDSVVVTFRGTIEPRIITLRPGPFKPGRVR